MVRFRLADRLFPAIAVVVVALAAAATPASAQSCRILQAELASALRGGGNPAQFERFDAAVDRQARELRAAEQNYGIMRCRGAISPYCRSLDATIGQMRANLARLTGIRDSHAGGASRQQIARLRAQVARACDASDQTRSASVRRQPGTRTAVRPQIINPEQAPGAVAGRPTGGSHRTLCVRTCDGYFFPISFATGPSGFARDEAVCAALCPAAPTKLFTHPTGDDAGPQSMVGLDGTPYADLQTAFDFRNKPRDPNCTCGRADPDAIGVAGVIESEDRNQVQPQAELALPLPGIRPDADADPESHMNAAQGLTRERIADIAGSVGVGEVHDMDDANRRVRVVGGQFLPDPEEAIDLRSPVPRGGR